MLAVIQLSIEAIVEYVIYFIVVGLIFGLLFYLIDYCETPQPWNKYLKMFIMVCGILLVIGMLLAFVGHPLFVLR